MRNGGLEVLPPPGPDAGLEQVLTPVDFSTEAWRAARLASVLARRLGVRQRVVHVDTGDEVAEGDLPDVRIETASAGRCAEVEVVTARSIAEGIVRELGEPDSSLLVTATRAHTAIAEAILSSTAEAVLQRWSGPIVAVGPRCESVTELHRIVFCVDPFLGIRSGVVDEVRIWAARLELPVTVFAVTSDSLPGERAAQARRLADVASRVSPQGAVPASVVCATSGGAAGNIAAFADVEQGTLIVAATNVRRLADRVIRGSVAMAACRLAASPVLLLPIDHIEDEIPDDRPSRRRRVVARTARRRRMGGWRAMGLGACSVPSAI